jgi:hypothetical protein
MCNRYIRSLPEHAGICELWHACYRLVNKYMRQPGLMKMRRTFTDKTFLLSDLASITFTYFLNSLYPSLKYFIQFRLIDIPQNRL